MDLLKKVPWDSLSAFAEFADCGNFTHAAARLHLSQPALHTKISNLADALETPLYVRRGRVIEITDAGRKVQRFAHELREAAHDFHSEIQGRDIRRPIVLIAGEGSYLYVLGNGIRSFRALSDHPLALQTGDGAKTVAAVRAGQAHLGVASLESAPDGIEAQVLTRVGQVLAMPAKHALASKRRIRLTDLRGADLIVPPIGRPHRTMISQMLQSEGVDWRVAIEATGWELMLQFVRLGLGLAIVNGCCRLPKGVVARPVPDLPFLQYSVLHLNRKLSKPVMELKRALITSGDAWKEED